MNEQTFVLAVRKRLGCHFLAEPVECTLCGKLMDTQMFHAECCAKSQSKIGHYNVVRKLVDGIQLADSRVRTEVRGLSETSDVRPADIFTSSALPGREAALDVTIVSAEASHAGQNCLQSAFCRKFETYANILPELRRQGIVFKPMVWSTEGAPHPVVLRIMAYVCSQAVRRNSDTHKGAKEMMSRWQRELSVALQTRKASMIAACIKAPGPHQQWLLSGKVDWRSRRMR